MKKFITIALCCGCLIGCSSGEPNVVDTFTSAETLINELDQVTSQIDQVIEEDLFLEEPKEMYYTTDQTFESLTKYLDANQIYMTDEITKLYNEKKNSIQVYDHLVEYEQRILRGDLASIKVKLHEAYLKKEQEYKEQIDTLNSLKKSILEEQEKQKKTIEESKTRRSNILHLIKNYKKNDQDEKQEIVSIKLDSIRTALSDYQKTQGKFSNLIDEKRSLVSSYNYKSLKKVYDSILEIAKQRSACLQKMNEDFQYLETSLQ